MKQSTHRLLRPWHVIQRPAPLPAPYAPTRTAGKEIRNALINANGSLIMVLPQTQQVQTRVQKLSGRAPWTSLPPFLDFLFFSSVTFCGFRGWRFGSICFPCTEKLHTVALIIRTQMWGLGPKSNSPRWRDELQPWHGAAPHRWPPGPRHSSDWG